MPVCSRAAHLPRGSRYVRVACCLPRAAQAATYPAPRLTTHATRCSLPGGSASTAEAGPPHPRLHSAAPRGGGGRGRAPGMRVRVCGSRRHSQRRAGLCVQSARRCMCDRQGQTSARVRLRFRSAAGSLHSIVAKSQSALEERPFLASPLINWLSREFLLKCQAQRPCLWRGAEGSHGGMRSRPPPLAPPPGSPCVNVPRARAVGVTDLFVNGGRGPSTSADRPCPYVPRAAAAASGCAMPGIAVVAFGYRDPQQWAALRQHGLLGPGGVQES
jgi:hypothetical protein